MESTEIRQKRLLSGITNNNVEEDVTNEEKSNSVSEKEKQKAIEKAKQYLKDQEVILK